MFTFLHFSRDNFPHSISYFICSKLQMTMPVNFIQNQLMVLNAFNKYNIISYVPLFNTQNFVTNEYIV